MLDGDFPTLPGVGRQASKHAPEHSAHDAAVHHLDDPVATAHQIEIARDQQEAGAACPVDLNRSAIATPSPRARPWTRVLVLTYRKTGSLIEWQVIERRRTLRCSSAEAPRATERAS
jgi:hypothetical protein